MFKSDSSINHNYNSKKNTDIIAKIFEDHWNNIPSNINNQFVNTNLMFIKQLIKLSIAIMKIWVVMFTNTLIVMIFVLLGILASLDFVLLAVTNINFNVLKISYLLLIIVNIGKLFLLVLKNFLKLIKMVSMFNFKNIKDGVEYVTRYCGRVAISKNRILNYDGNSVTFCYNSHVDNSYHEVTVSASQFITILLRHLLPSNFKIIRYFGFYRKKLYIIK